MKAKFKLTTCYQGDNEWTKEAATKKELYEIIESERKHYKTLNRIMNGDRAHVFVYVYKDNGEIYDFFDLV